MHRLRFALVGLGALALAFPAGAGAAGTVLVSHDPSPYLTCSPPPAGGTNYPNAEVEPNAASNPHVPGNLVAVWQQDRWSNGGAHGLAAGFSTDDGATWTQVTLPFDACAPGGLPFERASDPWVSIGPDGTAYANALSFNVGANFNTGVSAATSSDGGKTWSNTQLIELDKTMTGTELNDKNSITADPVTAGTAYSVWDDVSAPFAFNPHVLGFQGDAILSKTTDGGRSWSNAKIIVHTGNYTQTIGNVIVIDPTSGALYDFFDLILGTNTVGRNHGKVPTGPSPFNVAFVKSTDGGATWTDPKIVANEQTVGVPNTRTGDIIPEPAIDPATGRLYVVWQDSRFSNFDHDEVALSTSSDGGASWTAPTRVNDPTGQPAFTPAVTVNSAGTVGITYYQFLSQSSSSLPTEVFDTTSSDHAKTFGAASLITGPFDMTTAPNAGGFFVGDYEGLTTNDTEFHPVFVVTNTGNTTNRTDVVASKF
jgi:BNR repeat protein